MRKLYKHISKGHFTVLAQTSGPSYEDQEAFPPVRVLPFAFENWVVESLHIDIDKAKRVLESKLPLPHDMICLDVESAPLFDGRTSWSNDPAEWQQFVDTVLPVLEALRSVDDTLKWSVFGCCPSLEARHAIGSLANRTGRCLVHKDDLQEKRYREWLNLVELMRFQAEHLAPYLDWYCPSLYPDYWLSRYAKKKPGENWFFRDDHSQRPDDVMVSFEALTDEWDVLSEVIHRGLTVAQYILPDKPLIPILGMQWWQPQTEPWQNHERWEFVTPEWIHDALYQVRTLADSVAIWSQPDKVGMTSAEYYDGPLWRLVRRWAAQQTVIGA